MAALVWLFTYGIALAGGSQSPAPAPPASAIALTAEELQVVNAALDATVKPRLPVTLRRTSTLAIVPDATLAVCIDGGAPACIHESTQSTVGRLLDKWDASLAAAFLTRAQSPFAIVHLRERFAIVPSRDVDAIPPGVRWWDEFERRFGRVPFVQFSVPVLVGDRSAIIVRFGCGSLCGTVWLVTLEKRGERFRVLKRYVLLVS